MGVRGGSGCLEGAGQSFKFGGLYLRPPGDHRLWGGGVG